MEEGNEEKYQANRNVRSGNEGSDDDSVCGSFISGLIFVMSMILIICTFPFSLCVCIRMVQVLLQIFPFDSILLIIFRNYMLTNKHLNIP